MNLFINYLVFLKVVGQLSNFVSSADSPEQIKSLPSVVFAGSEKQPWINLKRRDYHCPSRKWLTGKELVNSIVERKQQQQEQSDRKFPLILNEIKSRREKKEIYYLSATENEMINWKIDSETEKTRLSAGNHLSISAPRLETPPSQEPIQTPRLSEFSRPTQSAQFQVSLEKERNDFNLIKHSSKERADHESPVVIIPPRDHLKGGLQVAGLETSKASRNNFDDENLIERLDPSVSHEETGNSLIGHSALFPENFVDRKETERSKIQYVSSNKKSDFHEFFKLASESLSAESNNFMAPEKREIEQNFSTFKIPLEHSKENLNSAYVDKSHRNSTVKAIAFTIGQNPRSPVKSRGNISSDPSNINEMLFRKIENQFLKSRQRKIISETSPSKNVRPRNLLSSKKKAIFYFNRSNAIPFAGGNSSLPKAMNKQKPSAWTNLLINCSKESETSIRLKISPRNPDESDLPSSVSVKSVRNFEEKEISDQEKLEKGEKFKEENEGENYDLIYVRKIFHDVAENEKRKKTQAENATNQKLERIFKKKKKEIPENWKNEKNSSESLKRIQCGNGFSQIFYEFQFSYSEPENKNFSKGERFKTIKALPELNPYNFSVNSFKNLVSFKKRPLRKSHYNKVKIEEEEKMDSRDKAILTSKPFFMQPCLDLSFKENVLVRNQKSKEGRHPLKIKSGKGGEKLRAKSMKIELRKGKRKRREAEERLRKIENSQWKIDESKVTGKIVKKEAQNLENESAEASQVSRRTLEKKKLNRLSGIDFLTRYYKKKSNPKKEANEDFWKISTGTKESNKNTSKMTKAAVESTASNYKISPKKSKSFREFRTTTTSRNFILEKGVTKKKTEKASEISQIVTPKLLTLENLNNKTLIKESEEFQTNATPNVSRETTTKRTKQLLRLLITVRPNITPALTLTPEKKDLEEMVKAIPRTEKIDSNRSYEPKKHVFDVGHSSSRSRKPDFEKISPKSSESREPSATDLDFPRPKSAGTEGEARRHPENTEDPILYYVVDKRTGGGRWIRYPSERKRNFPTSKRRRKILNHKVETTRREKSPGEGV